MSLATILLMSTPMLQHLVTGFTVEPYEVEKYYQYGYQVEDIYTGMMAILNPKCALSCR